MSSWQAKFFNTVVRALVRRRSWGRDEKSVARRARSLFGSPKPLQWLSKFGLKQTAVREKNVRGEWLETKNAGQGIIFYIHGGGFVSCSPETHRPITAVLARLTNFRVFAVDYRLAPEHRFPAGLDDIVTAYKWLLGQGVDADKIALAGDSAGAGLLLGLLLRLRDANLPLPASAVCFSAWADLDGEGESNKLNAKRDAMFYPENVFEFAGVYLGDGAESNEYSSPVKADFSDFPPVLFQVGSTEILLDDSQRIHEKIRAVGGTSQLEIYDDVFHCWHMLDGFLPEARTALNQAVEFIRRYVSHDDKT